MKKFILVLLVTLLCIIAGTCSAFELDRSRWNSYGNYANVEALYDASNISKSGNVVKMWLCYHYKDSDAYRLIYKEYTQGSNKARILKILDYYGDGTFRRGSAKVVENVAVGKKESSIVEKLW